MSPEEFLKEFGHLVETVGGIEAVRSSIFVLAISGRLTGHPAPRQNASEGPLDDVAPFTLPNQWRWITTENAGEVKLGRQRAPKNHRGPHMIPYLRVANVHENELRLDDVLQMNFSPDEQRTFGLKAGDVLLNEGQSFELVGRPAIYRGEIPGVCFQNTLLRFRASPDVLPEFALVVFRCYLRNGRFRAHAQQTTNIAHLSAGRLKTIEFPLPPLPEQERIVEKVDQLMALCDELEAKLKQKRTKAVVLNKAALSAVVHAPGKSQLKGSWSRVQDHFEVLYELPENVKELRQTILQLAVMGKLVRQDPRERVNFSELGTSEVVARPFDLPSNWVWSTTGQAGDVQLGRQRSPKNHRGPNMVPYLRVANVHENEIRITDVLQMNFSLEEQATFRLYPGDVLLNEGQSYELVGRPAIYRGELPFACFQNTLLRFRAGPATLPEFALAVFRCYLHNGRFRAHAQQTTNIAHLSGGRLKSIEYPLPPIGEQVRIVEKVDQFMTLCNNLEAKLAQSRDQGQRLMQAVVEGLVA